MPDEILTISVPEAGKRYFGLSRNGAYDAARRGEIPVIKVGRLKRVPVRAMEAKLDKLCRQPMGDVARELTDKLKGE
jgi:Helix-turn-helix domain